MRYPRKRPYRGPGKKFFRRRRPSGDYETLFTDTPTTDGLGRGIAISPGRFEVDPAAASTFPGSTESPPAISAASTAEQVVRVELAGGFTELLPLWDDRLANEYGHNCSLKSLSGYLRPMQLALLDNGIAQVAGRVFRVRLSIFPLEVSEEEATMGPGQFATPPVIIFSKAGQRRRIWWQRDWLIPADGAAGTSLPSDYWQSTQAGGAVKGQHEPRLASSWGSDVVSLRNCMRISKERWPVLGISVQGLWPGNFTTAASPGPLRTFGNVDGLKSCVVALNGMLRAYIQKA